MPDPLLDARDLRKTYGKGERAVHALQGASLGVHAGEMVAVQGRSGSGKTTLLNLVAGLDVADGGTVRLLGEDLSELGTRERLALRARGVGFVFQTPALVPELRLWENAAMAARIAGHPHDDARERAMAALTEVGLRGLEDRFPGEVSGGEAQRASVARALAKDPTLLLADEPTAELDQESARRVADVLLGFTGRGGGALVVTHDDLLASEAARRVHLRDGVLEGGGGA